MHDLLPNPKNSDLTTQISTLREILKTNKTVWRILEECSRTIRHPWYLGGGGIYHSVWNYYSNRPIEENLTDYDIFYFSKENNKKQYREVETALNSVVDDIEIDLTNIATVHEWFNKTFDRKIQPYNSIEEDINSFGNSVASIGVRKVKNEIEIYAPFGLYDIFAFEVHNMGGLFTKEEYLKKVQSWKSRWPKLKIHI